MGAKFHEHTPPVRRRSLAGPVLLIGGGIAVGAAAWFANRRATATTDAIKAAVSGLDGPPPALSHPALPGQAPAVAEPVRGGGFVQLRLTGYWPFQSGLDAAARKLEGGVKDRKGKPLVTLEQHLADPLKYPYVSLSGDDAIFPYGQKILIPWVGGKTVVGRVVDTGGHFRGVGKVYRVLGAEPIDVCVESSRTEVPKPPVVTAQILAGDNFAKGAAVATGKFQNQTVTAGQGAVRDGRTAEDVEALARALESELGDRPREEQLAAAWAMRNRADASDETLHAMLAPRDTYGAPADSGGYASTRRQATDASRALATEVLDAHPGEDPTGGATEFWVPSQQAQLRALGDVHRAAASSGDVAKAQRYRRYAGYGSEGDVRVEQARQGLQVLRVVGIVEILGKV